VDGGGGISQLSDGIDPARVSVVAVGVESYEYGDSISLPGAADEAVRFANWAVKCGVPPDRIVLACSRPANAPAGKEVPQVEAEQKHLEDIVVNLAKLTGDLLLIFWCGHGVVRDKRRVLFSADARTDYLRCLDLDQMLDFLRSARMTGFAQQVILVDACANFVDEVDSGGNWRDLVRPGNMPGGTQRDSVNQFVLFSAAQGQTAKFKKVERHALFSDTVLGWLEDTATGSLPLAVSELARHVVDQFSVFRDSRMTRQTPISLWHRASDGSEDYRAFGGEPVSGSVHARLQDAGLPIASVSRIATAVVEILNARDSKVHGPRFNALRLMSLVDEADQSLLLAAVIDKLAAGRATELFQALVTVAPTEEDRLAVHDVERQWSRLRSLTPALQVFSVAGLQDVRAAYYWAVPPSDEGTAPLDLDEAFERAAAYPVAVNHITALHRFVARLEQATGHAMDSTWFDVPDASLRALHAEAAAASSKPARLVIDLHNPEAPIGQASWPPIVVGHLHQPGAPWRSTTLACTPDLNGVKQAVASLLDWAYSQGMASFTVGLIVPRHVLDEVPEAWECGDEMTGSMPLWRDRPTVLHSAERMNNWRARARWQEKAELIQRRLRASPTDILWIKFDDRDAPDRIRDSVRQATAAAFGFEFVAGRCSAELHRDPIIAAVVAGAPYVIWVSAEPDDWPQIRQWVQTLAERGDFADMPQRLHEEHTKAPNLGCRLRMIWDAPETLPPTGHLPGLPTRGGHVA
jgi:hypothetical protein